MATQMVIIGLGQIGTSIGLALANQKSIQRVGLDTNLSHARQAEKMGALDKVSTNPKAAIKEADVVILAVPVDQIKDALETIAPVLKPNAIVVDTAPVKSVVVGWAKDILPAHVNYIGLTPAINAEYLMDMAAGPDAAHEDLFRKGLFAVVTPPGVSSGAIRYVIDLIAMLGADHLFMDEVEVDSLMAASHLLPQLMASALVSITAGQPGWQEGRKLAGRPYAAITRAISYLDDPLALSSASLYDKENVVRLIDDMIAALRQLRAYVQDQDEKGLDKRFQEARMAQMMWIHQRKTANWAAEETAPAMEIPSSKEWLGRLFGFQPKMKPKQ